MSNYTITVIYFLIYLGNQSVNSKIDDGFETGIKFRCRKRSHLSKNKLVDYGIKKVQFPKERFYKPILFLQFLTQNVKSITMGLKKHSFRKSAFLILGQAVSNCPGAIVKLPRGN